MLRAAGLDPRRLMIGVDTDAASMRAAARRAARNGVANACFVVSAVEALPRELAGVADSVTISFPWGSLLRGLVRGDGPVPTSIAGICRPGASLTAVWSLTERDRSVALEPDPTDLTRRLERFGLEVTELRAASTEDVAATCSSWAKRLGVGRRRPATVLRAVKI